DAIEVIAGIMPADLMSQGYKALYERKHRDLELSFDDNKSIRIWQTAGNGRWTYMLINNVYEWSNRKLDELDFYLTQFLSGHGCFRQYLHIYGHDTTPLCALGCTELEDAEHIFFHCPYYRAERDGANRGVGNTLTAENIVGIMLERKKNWDCVKGMCAKIMKEQRRLERLRHLSSQ
ncbi:hypothetical protein KR222_006688, partial [Zaprionus bogoriensis]